MKKNLLVLIALFAVVCLPCEAQTRDPHIGYIYPAGNRAGETIEVIIGGMNLNGVERGTISGKGVTFESVKSFKPFNSINKDVRRELLPIFKAITDGRDPLKASKKNSEKQIERLRKQNKKSDALKDSTVKPVSEKKDDKSTPQPAKKDKAKKGKGKKGAYRPSLEEQLATVPGERLIYIDMTPEEVVKKIKLLSLMEYNCLLKIILGKKSVLQATPALDQIVVAKIKVATGAEPGVRELRLFTKSGESNPMLFVVGTLPEVMGNAFSADKENPPRDITLPVVVNGQIMPGEVDRLRFKVEKGKTYSIEVAGRKLIPFLGDAVPGWFQPVISLYNKDNKQIAFADDNNYDPDPVLEFTSESSGIYELRIRDSIYRGREDFVYRITFKEGKLHTQSQKNKVKIYPDLKKLSEVEPNNTLKIAQKIEYPLLIAGTINSPGDIDCFAFTAEKGEKISVEIIGRRAGSPIDSKIYLLNSEGKVLAWNDDYKWGNFGTETHHADSYFLYEIPEDGNYFVQVADTQNHGGREYSYKLRIDKTTPGFEIYANPSVLNLRSGMSTPVTFNICRKDGFDGAVDLSVKSAPKGVRLDGISIQKGSNKVRMTLFVPNSVKQQNYKIEFIGKSNINGKEIIRNVIPSEDIMQAFLWRHIVPTVSMNMNIIRKGWNPLSSTVKTVTISPGDSREIIWVNRASKSKNKQNYTLELDAPPKGVTINKSRSEGQQIIITLSVAKDAKEWHGNLLFKLIAKGSNRKKKKKYSYLAGYLPALPCRIEN